MTENGMPSVAATRRASRKSSSEQQPLPVASPQRRIETPITSYPASTSKAAATELSTPPLMPTTTQSPGRGSVMTPWSARVTDAPHDRRSAVDETLDVVNRVRAPETEAHTVARRIGAATERPQHVRRFAGARRRRAPAAGDGPRPPAAHADPLDTATPSRSSAATSVSPRAPAKVTLSV